MAKQLSVATPYRKGLKMSFNIRIKRKENITTGMTGLQVELDNLYMPYVGINWLFLNFSEALKRYSRTDILSHPQLFWPTASVAYHTHKQQLFLQLAGTSPLQAFRNSSSFLESLKKEKEIC